VPAIEASAESRLVYRRIALSTVVIVAIVAAVSALAAQEPAAKPPHERILDLLRGSDAVIPPTIDMHPVAATYNREAIIPPQCYTRTEGRHNPCYVCHQDPLPGRENTMGDADLQAAYSFSDLGLANHWLNLFEDRRARVAKISDAEIRTWVAQDNYSELPQRLREAGFEGWIPDLRDLPLGAGAFDAEGFAKDGSHWVAFNYKPFPSTFWPTNGSTDDVMIRLPEPYRTDTAGRYSRDVYRANLAVVEAAIKGLDSIGTLPIDERAVDADLDGDGKLGIAHRIARVAGYVGAAQPYFFGRHLYPQGTEFLHTVRYVNVDANGQIGVSRRIKEVRYMLKAQMMAMHTLAEMYREEGYEKDAGYLPGYTRLGDKGLDNGAGWAIQGFIEGRDGRLRASTYEENLFCMGCHNSIGSTIDKTFSMARKVDGAAGWGYINLKGMPDAPNVGETVGEIATYLARVGGGSEFRNNPEMTARWFNADGSVNHAALRGRDVYDLVAPSPQRALQLNKAYRVIVEDQDYLYGRDAIIEPPKNVYDRIDNATTPTLPPEFQYRWDIRLDWSQR
jgi:hypothetical protein